MVIKHDLKKELDAYRAHQNEFRFLRVPAMQYLMIDGYGDPNTSTQFADAITTIYPVAYALKFMSKDELERDYVVMPLEGQWWAEDANVFTRHRDKSKWSWTLLNMIPDWITEDHFERAMSAVSSKHPETNFSRLRLESLDESLCLQTLHVGSFDDEGPILAEMHHHFIPDNNLELTGRHHEIYLSDFRRVDSAKLRTILRQPVIEKS